ncbi:MAG: SpoVR family protein [Candidatus Niyogibacteria bacterium]|nr:SpoVR family protein [Candidatus Niyogibacteria bacterium]
MENNEIKRLETIERRIKAIAEENGLSVVEIDFEIVSAQKMLEGMAYMFPTNFSHWSFGRDYEKARTIYDHTGAGIPYEVVWNFDVPRAFIVESNPFALKALVIAHVYGHVDFFLNSRYSGHGRVFSDIAEEARHAAQRFREYELLYGKEAVEKTIDAAMSIRWQAHPDTLFEEELDNEAARERLMNLERAKLRSARDLSSEFSSPPTAKEIAAIEGRLRQLSERVPPEPIYDLLGYIGRYSTRLNSWQRDIISVVRNQARALAPNARTKLLNEGWATFWHARIMRRLFEEKLLTPEEHGIFNDFHSGVTRESRLNFNWYSVGPALIEYIEERWDRGCFGRAYEDCRDPIKKAHWDTGANKGREKILAVRSFYSDRMAVEEFFTDEFIDRIKLYIYEAVTDPHTGDIHYVIAEKDPEVIRGILKSRFAAVMGTQPIVIKNADHNNRGELYLFHDYGATGAELDERYRDGALENLQYLWARKVHLETVISGKQAVCSYDSKQKKVTVSK